MNPSAPFIVRPVATSLLTVAVLISGALGFARLPVSPLPNVDLPTITVAAQLPGASPKTVATSVAEPLERHLSQIAAVSEMSSQSTVGETRITLQFELSRDINGAARDVQAAINAARADLPSNMPNTPTYRKFNPAETPILAFALTSKTLTTAAMYEIASNILAQRLAQIRGVGNVSISGTSPPAVRVELNPFALSKYGIGLEDVRAALASANANSPKGSIDDHDHRYQIYSNDQANVSADYAPLVIAYRNGSVVRLSDVAQIVDSVEDVHNIALANGQNSVLVQLSREPGANIVETLDRVKAELPHLEAAMPAGLNLKVAMDRGPPIRSSLRDTELALATAALLVAIVVFIYLRSISATVIASIAMLTSVIGTFGAMWCLGYSLVLLSLMALTIATGFAIDDTVIVLENISVHLELGMTRREAALRGTQQVASTVLSISLSLIAAFTPIILMNGIVGRMLREFSVTLAIAVLISLLISLTTVPTMCATFLRTPNPRQISDDFLARGYLKTLRAALHHSRLVAVVFLTAICLNVTLFLFVPKGLLPQQDTGRLYGWLQADQSISFHSLGLKLRQMMNILREDPAVESVIGFAGSGSGFGGSRNTAAALVTLKPFGERSISARQVMARLRPSLAQIPGGNSYLGIIQELQVGTRQSDSQYQFTLLSEAADDVDEWSLKLADALQRNSVLADVSSHQRLSGLESYLDIDRDTAARLNISPRQIDNTLYDAFGQRQVSIIYGAYNQYHVVMEVDPRYAQDANSLRDVYVSTVPATPAGTAVSNAPTGTVIPGASATKRRQHRSNSKDAIAIANASTAQNASTNALADGGKGNASAGAAVTMREETMIPLAVMSRVETRKVSVSVNHEGTATAATISFDLQPNHSLGDAIIEISRACARIRMPASIHGSFTGTAKLFQSSLNTEPVLILSAIVVVYILLGMLYESYIHPVTILSTLPSASVGALLALILLHMEFDILGMIGLILLIGITMKNAIMMIDFAIEAKRTKELSAHDAISQACSSRFRAIMMTTTAALLGAVPLAFGWGEGGEIRRPLGVAIIGGLIVSQLVTLYTTPVIYLYMDRLSSRSFKQLLGELREKTLG
jgi:multidrug efflux pump